MACSETEFCFKKAVSMHYTMAILFVESKARLSVKMVFFMVILV
jgi:hypothetical protein